MVQWYPGHMAKAFREMDEKIKFVDLVIVLLDARVPESSLNPEVVKKFQNKQILYVLTKADKADSEQTKKWCKHYESNNAIVISVNSKDSSTKKIVMKAIQKVLEEKRKKDALKGLRPRAIKAMVVGIPNVGKSTLINNLSGKKVASVGDKPGVTKAQQWIKLNQDLELLDTPGVLWPKFESPHVGLNLALTGAIKDDILRLEDIVEYGVKLLHELYPGILEKRYNVKEDFINDYATHVAKEKKFYANGEIDYNRVCMLILNDLRNGALGNITLDRINHE
ncbi:MAG: ribosome biogenesis GTPase YlqF [Bacilli bacterium]|nr:ribosome biogenesis GTPase YlqF [Bacilli bacterium]